MQNKNKIILPLKYTDKHCNTSGRNAKVLLLIFNNISNFFIVNQVRLGTFWAAQHNVTVKVLKQNA